MRISAGTERWKVCHSTAEDRTTYVAMAQVRRVLEVLTSTVSSRNKCANVYRNRMRSPYHGNLCVRGNTCQKVPPQTNSNGQFSGWRPETKRDGPRKPRRSTDRHGPGDKRKEHPRAKKQRHERPQRQTPANERKGEKPEARTARQEPPRFIRTFLDRFLGRRPACVALASACFGR